VRSRPNHGIWNSLQSAIWTTIFSYPLGIILSCVLIVLGPLIDEILGGKFWAILFPLLQSAFPAAFWAGLGVAALFGFVAGGGKACVQHLALRMVLTQQGKIPWDYARFLNYCTERRLLQRVGGRYRFIHRELLDHFANRAGESRAGVIQP
jgi:hypothetical protein